MTHPAQPVHRPVVMASSYSSFHCAVQRSALGAGVSVTVMSLHSTDPHPPTPTPGVFPQLARQIHRGRWVGRTSSPKPSRAGAGLDPPVKMVGMELNYTPEAETFRKEIRASLEEHLPD